MSKQSDQAKTRKIQAWKRGRAAETIACFYLRLTGHHILGRNVKTPFGEIDVIARRGAIVCFVEVKARHTVADAARAIALRQQGRIARASQYVLATRPALATCRCRYDVALFSSAWRFRYLRDAWRPD